MYMRSLQLFVATLHAGVVATRRATLLTCRSAFVAQRTLLACVRVCVCGPATILA